MDPLDKNVSSFDFSNSKNPILDAFEAAASSLAVNKGIPNSQFHQISNSAPNTKKASEPKRAEPSIAPVSEVPVPSNATIYPPPVIDDSDIDRTRLLHSWYWAGYYMGLADGKKIAQSKNDQ